MKINLGKKEIIHFIGIGGIGMSGLALIMKQLGFKIQGSDISINKNIERLKKSKIKIFTKHQISNLNKANIIVISSAIKNNNIELKAAKKKDLPIYKRGDMLAHMISLKKNIVVFVILAVLYLLAELGLEIFFKIAIKVAIVFS